MNAKKYDRAYFDRWYRDPQHRVKARGETRRKVQMAVGLAEYYLGRTITNVLDIGCGEGIWRSPLRALRPGIDYLGLDSSDYAISRFGRSRNLRPARFADLAELRFDRRFDLIICSDVAHYLGAAELRRGLSGFPELLEGLAFIELFTSKDPVDGDTTGFISRSPKWYRECFASAGLMACGSHCYLAPDLMRSVSALERAEA
ncbi:class I SAM-dependent DNA methyltransferase [Dokdonella sp.]|uniref:class I SAM-dependent DNA methyltransferase n=1 Tax=Dokdonella sp. TaxID=2291710 RepID=UPI003C5D98DA